MGALWWPLLLVTAAGQGAVLDPFEAAVRELCQKNRLKVQDSRCIELWRRHAEGCYRIKENRTGPCPAECRVTVPVCGGTDWRCGRELDCGLLQLRGYVEKVSWGRQCKRICKIVGCDHCETDERCEVCNAGFKLMDNGQCRWKFLIHGLAILGCFVLFMVYIVVSAIRMHLRGDSRTINKRALEAGLQSRYRAQVAQTTKRHCPKYPLTVNMHIHKKGEVPICGPGMTLFMNWFILLAIVGIWLTLLAWVFADSQTGCRAAASTLLRDDVKLFPVWTGLSYLGSTFISFIFFIWQRKLWVTMTHDNEGEVRIQAYAVQATGFPKTAVDKARLLDFFREGLTRMHLPPDMIQYISIAYAYGAEDATWVNAAIDRHLEDESSRYELRQVAELSGESESEDSSTPTSAARKPDAGPLWLQLAAYTMLGVDVDYGGAPSRDFSTFQHDVGTKLSNLRSSGNVFVVLKSQGTALAMQSYVRMPNTFEGHIIKLKLVESAPQVIYWDKFYLTKKDKVWRVLGASFFVAATVIFWFLCYAPTAWVYRMSVNAEGSVFLTFVQSAMGLVIIVGNSMLGLVVGLLTDWIGFKRQATQLHAKLLLLVPLMLLNVLCDMYWIVWRPSNEAFADDSYKSHVALVMEAHELVLGLLPSYCVVPYIGEPLICILGVLWIGIWRVKRDARITPQQAERILVAQSTDIVNPPYCDFICTTTIIVSTFVISPSEAHCWIFPWILVAAAVLYAQVRLRVLRWESRSYYGTNRLDSCEAAWWALPLAILAAAWERNLFEPTSLANPELSLRGWRFFTMHVLMHQLFLKFVLPTFEPQMPASLQTYKESHRRQKGHAALADFLNANPVEVLKSHQQPEFCTGQKLTFYRTDKEHLQERAVKDFKGDCEYALLLSNTMSGNITGLSPHVTSLMSGLSPKAFSPSQLFSTDNASESSSDDSVPSTNPQHSRPHVA